MRPSFFRYNRLWLGLSVAALVSGGLAALNLRPPHTPQCKLSIEAEQGRIWAKTCAQCHDIDSRQPKTPSGGPNLHDIYMSRAGTQSIRYGYNYYPPLVAARNAGLIWTAKNLELYLKNPEHFLKNITGLSFDDAYYMNFYIGGDEQMQVHARRDVVAFLREIKGRTCECAAPRVDDMRCGST